MANTPTAIENQVRYLRDKVKSALAGKDLNIFGYDRDDLLESVNSRLTDYNSSVNEYNEAHKDDDGFNAKATIELLNDDAIKNQVLLWLTSKKGDFPRNSNNSGILYDILGKIENNTNVAMWENLLKTEFNLFFKDSGLSLQYVKIDYSTMNKIVTVSMLVTDVATQSVTQLIERFNTVI